MDKKYLFDTSSLMIFVKYHLPFDRENTLQEFLLKGFKDKSFILLKEVENECKRTAGGLVFERFLKPKDIKSTSFNEIIEPKLHNMIDNNFRAKLPEKKKLTQAEYEAQKEKFAKSADFKLIHYAMKHSNSIIITEESLASNDNKTFKKIPAICRENKIEYLNFVDFLEKYLEISIKSKVRGSLFEV